MRVWPGGRSALACRGRRLRVMPKTDSPEPVPECACVPKQNQRVRGQLCFGHSCRAAACRPPARLCSVFLTAPYGRCAPARATRLGRRRAGTISGPGRLRVALSGLAAQAPAEHFGGGGRRHDALAALAPTMPRLTAGGGQSDIRRGRRARAWRPAVFLGVPGAGGRPLLGPHIYCYVAAEAPWRMPARPRAP